LSVAALVKIFPLHHELGELRDAARNPACFIRGQMVVSEADALNIVAAMNVGQRHALGITDDEWSRAVPVDSPGR
jgi:hypothetical protein